MATYLIKPATHLVSIRDDGNVDFSYQGRLEDPRTSQERSIINLKDVDTANYNNVLNAVGINPISLFNLYRYLGEQGNKNNAETSEEKIMALGSEKFENYKRNELITLERVGQSKHGEAKFYLMINEIKGWGANNVFHIGVSRKGSIRAITRSQQSKWYLEEDVCYNSIINAWSKCKALGKSSNIARLMSYEKGVKVSELGCENLSSLIKQNLTKQERLIIYINLIQGLAQLWELGLVHGDIRGENIVVQRDGEGKICGAKIIDLETITTYEQIRDTNNPNRDLSEAMWIIETMENHYLPADKLFDEVITHKNSHINDFINLIIQVGEKTKIVNPERPLNIDPLVALFQIKQQESEYKCVPYRHDPEPIYYEDESDYDDSDDLFCREAYPGD